MLGLSKVYQACRQLVKSSNGAGSLDSFLGTAPSIHATAYVADGAKIIGDVTLQSQSSVWFNAVLRGDGGPLTVGPQSNIQDGAILHCLQGGATIIGSRVSVGHGAILHGCHVEDQVLIGMGAIIMDGAVIKSGCVIAAGALIPQGVTCPPGLYVGSPARQSVLPAHIRSMIDVTADRYLHYAETYWVQKFGGGALASAGL